MSYKLKSLFYLICFITAVVTYYSHGKNDYNKSAVKEELAKVEMSAISIEETMDTNTPE